MTTRSSATESQKKKRPPQASAASQEIDIIEAVKRDHQDLKELIEILKNEDKSMREKEAAYKSFSVLLKSHTRSEEKALYEKCLKDDELEVQTHEAYVEHNMAALLMKSISATRDASRKEAQMKVLAESVEHHIDEEEEELLPQVEKEFDSGDRIKMGSEFIGLRERTGKLANEDHAGVLSELKH